MRLPPIFTVPAGLVMLLNHATAAPFAIKVSDEATGRGVPLAELETVNHVSYWTDSNGMIAIDDPDLLGRRVFFYVRSHGYFVPADGFGIYGRAFDLKPGGNAEVKMKRTNIAERLYRLTGDGIFRDSRILGQPAPAENNGLVAGQDTTMAMAYAGKIYWLGGDTLRLSYPLGHFRTCGATSPAADIDPERFIPREYFTSSDGFSSGLWPFLPEEKKMLLMWTDGLLVAPDASGKERMIAHYELHSSLDKVEEHGLGTYNDETQVFDRTQTFELTDTWRHPRGQPVIGRDENRGYFLFRASDKHPAPFPAVRTKATLAALSSPESYEAFTCLDPSGEVVTNSAGNAVWKWRGDASPLTQSEEAALIRSGKLKVSDAHSQLRVAETGEPIEIHAGSVRWNDYRKKWVLIASQRGGSSFLGEIWYAEADEVTGPWRAARKIVTHERQSFYNPVQHDFLDREGGRFIYFEGTYTNEFSGNPAATPRYQYNQIMYRLDLSDPRLAK